LLEASTQAREFCPSPTGAPVEAVVAVTIPATGVVSARMTSGPTGTEAEVCVLSAFSSIRVQRDIHLDRPDLPGYVRSTYTSQPIRVTLVPRR
jgi:hypothetical protein